MENQDYYEHLKTYKKLNAICKKMGYENVEEFLEEFEVLSFYMSETMGSKN